MFHIMHVTILHTVIIDMLQTENDSIKISLSINLQLQKEMNGMALNPW